MKLTLTNKEAEFIKTHLNSLTGTLADSEEVLVTSILSKIKSSSPKTFGVSNGNLEWLKEGIKNCQSATPQLLGWLLIKPSDVAKLLHLSLKYSGNIDDLLTSITKEEINKDIKYISSINKKIGKYNKLVTQI